jgi:hypothetical protein
MIYKIPEVAQEIQSFFGKLHEALAHQVTRMIEEQLEREVNAWLYRSWHQRRQSVKRHSQAYCQKCGSQCLAPIVWLWLEFRAQFVSSLKIADICDLEGFTKVKLFRIVAIRHEMFTRTNSMYQFKSELSD